MYPFTIGLLISSPDLYEEVQAALKPLPVRVGFEMATVESASVLADKVERYRAEIVLVETTGIEAGFADLLADVKQLAAPPVLVVVSKSADPDRILAAMRAGVNEYLYSPVGDALKESLDRLSKNFTAPDRRGAETTHGRTVGFLSAKGGCGATTLACHAAVEIASRTGKQTVLADLDLGSGLVRFLMQCKNRYSIVDAMRNVESLDRAYWSGLVSNGRPSLEIIAAPAEETVREISNLHDVRHVLRFARTQYAWVLADLGHGLDQMAWNAVEELDELVLVSTLDIPALHRAKVAARQLLEAGFDKNKLHFVVNRVPRTPDFSIEDLEGILKLKVFETVPDDHRALDACYAEGRLLGSDQPLRQRIARLAGKLAGIAQPQQKPRSRFAIFR